jgi:hypothetical protein
MRRTYLEACAHRRKVKKLRSLAESILLAIGVFVIMAICIVWPFLLVQMSGG